MRAAIYARVSTAEQTPESQIRELLAVAQQRGWEVVEVYSDNGVSGAKGRDQRPRLAALLRASVRREHDVMMAWSVDRLGRSLQDLVGPPGRATGRRGRPVHASAERRYD